MLEEITFEYQNLIFKIEQRCSRLEKYYQEHLVCKHGCSKCCQVERSVLPIEAYFIEQQLKTFSKSRIRKMRLNHKKDDQNCPMLWHNHCAIYSARPISCRVHGLPILYVEAEIEFVDYCRLNFTQLPEAHVFDKKHIIDLEKYNRELARLDQRFRKEIAENKWDPFQKISLRAILFDKKFG